ncbi:helix-turn-helix domain-containing protein [Pedomonas mirosovicensis]|uniref:helix-turn-helix domain-containing protein n=1 Tax=Pedomonas mirosovicensis TaxID=2908641 RepID=UPI002168AA70|nr:helix-turn-helix transcriptional regulator [Pedomonas mirosovicensis]MCH8684844.1 helix-turn-helix transcriptional regulator [Pedomonas mirosovicensis]
MHTRIREVRKAKGLTLAEVAARCSPPTTAQTIGRLETGTRTVSVGWLNRIAAALGVEPSELVSLPDRPDVPVAAVLGTGGAESPRRAMMLAAPLVQPNLMGMIVEVAQGDYRAGDEIWLSRLPPEQYGEALNKDVLAPLTEGRFAFGRLISAEADRLLILPPVPGVQPIAVSSPRWIAAVNILVRRL